jgi:succinate-acetate transporter protein
MSEKNVPIQTLTIRISAFALTTFVLSCVNANLVPDSVVDVFLLLGLIYGRLAQLLAGM